MSHSFPLSPTSCPPKPGQRACFVVEAWGKGGLSILGFFLGPGQRAIGTFAGTPDLTEPH